MADPSHHRGGSENPVFLQQAKRAVNFVEATIDQLGIEMHRTIILDLGCGGDPEDVGRGYPPLFLKELGLKGWSNQQLLGYDIASQPKEMAEVYEHFVVNLLDELGDVNSAEGFLSSILKQHPGEMVFITSNNFFGNVPPGLHQLVDIMFDNLLQAAEKVASDAGLSANQLAILTFDAFEEGTDDGVYLWDGEQLGLHEGLNDQLRAEMLKE